MRREKGGRTPFLGPNYFAYSRRVQKKAFILVSLAPPPTLFAFFSFLAFSSAIEKHVTPRSFALFKINSFCFLYKFSPSDVSRRY